MDGWINRDVYKAEKTKPDNAKEREQAREKKGTNRERWEKKEREGGEGGGKGNHQKHLYHRKQ